MPCAVAKAVVPLRRVACGRSEIIEISIRVWSDEVMHARHWMQPCAMASPGGIKAPGELSLQSIHVGQIADGKHATGNGID